MQADDADATYPWTDKTPSDFQSDVAVSGGKVTGTLAYIDGGLSPSGPLAGDGYFLALKWSAPAQTVTSVKVGLTNSAGTGLVEAIDDPDRDVVMKITDKNTQKFCIIQSDGTNKNRQLFDLKGLVLEEVEGA